MEGFALPYLGHRDMNNFALTFPARLKVSEIRDRQRDGCYSTDTAIMPLHGPYCPGILYSGTGVLGTGLMGQFSGSEQCFPPNKNTVLDSLDVHRFSA